MGTTDREGGRREQYIGGWFFYLVGRAFNNRRCMREGTWRGVTKLFAFFFLYLFAFIRASGGFLIAGYIDFQDLTE